VDWSRHLASLGRSHPYSLLADVALAVTPAVDATRSVPVEELVRQVLDDPDAARETILTELLHRLAVVLGLAPADRDRLRPTIRDLRLVELGLDSLALVRLRNILIVDFAADVPPDLLFGGATGGDVVELICQQLTLRHVMASPVDAPGGGEPVELLTI
jgi:acyl carrier protein